MSKFAGGVLLKVIRVEKNKGLGVALRTAVENCRINLSPEWIVMILLLKIDLKCN